MIFRISALLLLYFIEGLIIFSLMYHYYKEDWDEELFGTLERENGLNKDVCVKFLRICYMIGWPVFLGIWIFDFFKVIIWDIADKVKKKKRRKK